jgi:hypothetical protein
MKKLYYHTSYWKWPFQVYLTNYASYARLAMMEV